MRRMTKQDNDTARQLFEEAVALDPKYVGPYVNLGWTNLGCEIWMERIPCQIASAGVSVGAKGCRYGGGV